MDPVIYADLRCLQDYNYRIRGIGHHVSALIRTRKHNGLANCKLIGLTNPEAPRLPDEYCAFVDEVTCSLNPVSTDAPAVFIDGTPMTHDPRFSLRFLARPEFLTAAVIYDFIPLDWPGYLPGVANRIEYLGKLARLQKFKLFLPISEYAGWRLSTLLGVSPDRVRVTGASVRSSLYDLRSRLKNLPSPYSENEPYFLIVIASDPRKNPEVAVKAVRHLNLLHSRVIRLKVAGHYGGDPAYKRNLLRLAGHAEGEGFLEFCPAISDEELVSLFAGAMATIAPSHIEGFSLPVVEASVCGCPVIASTCAAHLELVEEPEALFRSDDVAGLCEKLDALLGNPLLRDSLVASQGQLAAKYSEEAVGRRFWRAIEIAHEQHRQTETIAKPSRPRLAFLSPYPPDQSAAARYMAMTIRAGQKFFRADLFSDAPRPLTFEGRFRDAGKVSIAPLLQAQYRGIISVLGNQACHSRIFKVFEQFGGPCILHDLQIPQTLLHGLGEEKFLALAATYLRRPVSKEEANNWAQQGNAPALFLDSIIQRAAPLIVHTTTQRALLNKQYGVDAQVLTSCPAIFFEEQELTAAAKGATRERYGVPRSAFLVTSFGSVDRVNGMETCILATELLQSWKIPVELYFVGAAGPQKSEVDRIAAFYGVKHVHAGLEFASEVAYREFLIASDAGVQLRNYGYGQPSVALSDCIGAGLSCIANTELAQSCDAPGYVLTVPDSFSPLQVAEQLARVWESRAELDYNAHGRAAYLETHNFEYYVKRLMEILAIA